MNLKSEFSMNFILNIVLFSLLFYFLIVSLK